MNPDRHTAAGSPWSLMRPDGTLSTGWALMPLRLFLGVTFLYAGLQKLANPQFLRNTSPISIHAQLVGATHSSPIHALIVHLVPIAPALGVVIAVGEVAIGTGVLVGLLTRVAAVAGMALSFGLFLTVSFHSSPYFTGSDIVFFFAWTPLALAGAAGAPALDTWLAGRPTHASRRRIGLRATTSWSRTAREAPAVPVTLHRSHPSRSPVTSASRTRPTGSRRTWRRVSRSSMGSHDRHTTSPERSSSWWVDRTSGHHAG